MKIFELVSVIIGCGIALWLSFGYIFEGNIESPPFKLIGKQKGYEIREYQKLTVIKTKTSNQNSGFRQLFRMIDGNNAANKKIPMTAPVIQDQTTMMFVMPNSMKIVPKPNDQNIQVQEMGPLTVAVKTFRGYATYSNKELSTLKAMLKKDGLKSKNIWYLCQYNSPWTFPLLRKNEIWIVINQNEK